MGPTSKTSEQNTPERSAIKWLTRFCLEVFTGQRVSAVVVILSALQRERVTDSLCREKKIVTRWRTSWVCWMKFIIWDKFLMQNNKQWNLIEKSRYYDVCCDMLFVLAALARWHRELCEAKNSKESSLRPGRTQFFFNIYLCRILRCRCQDKRKQQKKTSNWTGISFTLATTETCRRFCRSLARTSVGKLVERHLNYPTT